MRHLYAWRRSVPGGNGSPMAYPRLRALRAARSRCQVQIRGADLLSTSTGSGCVDSPAINQRPRIYQGSLEAGAHISLDGDSLKTTAL